MTVPANTQVAAIYDSFRRLSDDMRALAHTPPVEPTEETATGSQAKTAIIYNPASFDSVFAAAQLVGSQVFADVCCIQHTPLEHADRLLAGFEQIYVVGTELSKDTMAELYNADVGLTIFSYRDGYSWLKERDASRWGERLEMRFPNDEQYSELTDLTDNTAIWLTFEWLHTHGQTKQIPLLEMSRTTALRQVSHAWPVVPDLTPIGQAVSHKEEIVYKSILFNMFPALQDALRSQTPLQKLNAIKVNQTTDSYLQHWQKMANVYGRGQIERPYKTGKHVLWVPTVACNEVLHYDLMMLASTHDRPLITYEDVAGLRIWRIFVSNRSHRLALLASIEGRMTWVDGHCVCTYTQVRELL